MAVAVCSSVVSAVEWYGLEGGNRLSGSAVSPESFENRTVLYFAFDETRADSIEAFKLFQRVSAGFAGKAGLAMIVSARGGDAQKAQALAAAARLTCPVYNEKAGFQGVGARVPGFTVVSPAGEVVYRGASDRDATEAMVNAMSVQVVPGSLIPGVELKKFKAMQKDLVLGKNVESKLTQLKSAAKRSGADGAEAKAILAALEKSRDRLSARIARNLAKAPAAALADIQSFVKTWPSGAARYAEEKKNLEANPEVKKLVAAYAVYAKYSDRPPQNASQAKSALAALRPVVKQLGELAGAAANRTAADEARALQGRFEAAISACEAMVAPKGK